MKHIQRQTPHRSLHCRNKRWIRTLVPVLAGFLALYLVMMAIATFLMQKNFMETFEESYTSMITGIGGAFIREEEEHHWIENESAESASLSYNRLMNSRLQSGGSKYFQSSCAVFDEDDNLLFQNKNFLSFLTEDGPMEEILFPADDYLSKEELREFAFFVYQKYTHFPDRSIYLSSSEEASPDRYTAKSYRITLVLTKETDIPVRLMVQERNLDGGEGEETGETASAADSQDLLTPEDTLWFPNVPWDHSKVVWVWRNPDIQVSEEPQERFYETEAAPGSSFPYLSYGYESWLAWQENTFLQDLQPDRERLYTMTGSQAAANAAFPFRPQTKRTAPVILLLHRQSYSRCFFVAAADCHPWLAAMDAMRYFYLFGFACMLLCTGILTFCICRTERRREALENDRRALTQTMAHDLKAPLDAIQGFAENLKQNPESETQEYDLDQIILKTEEIDSLAVEMIIRKDPKE